MGFGVRSDWRQTIPRKIWQPRNLHLTIAFTPDGAWSFLRRQRRNNGMVLFNQAQFRCPTRRAKVVEELHVRGVVLLPFFRNIVLVINRFYRAHWLTSTAVD